MASSTIHSTYTEIENNNTITRASRIASNNGNLTQKNCYKIGQIVHVGVIFSGLSGISGNGDFVVIPPRYVPRKNTMCMGTVTLNNVEYPTFFIIHTDGTVELTFTSSDVSRITFATTYSI